MYALGRGGSRRSINIWPGFVDALATLLLVVIFVLMVFMIAQYFLSTALTGRDEALQRLEREISELADILSLERDANADLRINLAQISSELQSSLVTRESLQNQLAALAEERDDLSSELAGIVAARDAAERRFAELAARAGLNQEELEDAYKSIEANKEKIEAQLVELAILKSLRDDMVIKLASTEMALNTSEEERAKLKLSLADAQALLAEKRAREKDLSSKLVEAQDLSQDAQIKIELLNRQIASLRQQLARIEAILETTEAADKAKDVRIADLGRRLNVALASKVQELSRYRSEFFGRLREVLGDHPGIQIVGDRFVFQSEVLFDSGSAVLEAAGKEQMHQLAETLIELSANIPAEVDWILRVDGHTDVRPIATPEFPSNWELSTGRAISVVRYLTEQGIPAERLAATGFGQFQPLDPADTLAAFRKTSGGVAASTASGSARLAAWSNCRAARRA
jgi:chemotaxis protein MotB